MPAQITFAEAPYNVPFPLVRKINHYFVGHVFGNLPPKHGPNATAHTSGCTGTFNDSFSANVTTTFIIIAVTGAQSTNDEVIAET